MQVTTDSYKKNRRNDAEALTVGDRYRHLRDSGADLREYRRHLVTPDGISPCSVPGTAGGMNPVAGNEHNEWGQVSADPENRFIKVRKREREIPSVHSALPLARRWGPGDASTELLGVGMETGVIVEARERLEIENVSFESTWSTANNDPPASGRPLTSVEKLAIKQLMMSYTV